MNPGDTNWRTHVAKRSGGPSVLVQRRQSLLNAINANDLYRMREHVDGNAPMAEGPLSAALIRAHIFNNWDRYAEELKRWADFTITGESTLLK